MLSDLSDPPGVLFITGELFGPRHPAVRVGSVGHPGIGPQIWAGQQCSRRRFYNPGGQAPPPGQVGRVGTAWHARRGFIDRRIPGVAGVGVIGMPVRLVADGEAGHVLPVAAPDVPRSLSVDRCQVTDWAGRGAEHAQRVDDLHPGHGGEGKQVVDSGESITARAGRDQLIHRAPADSQAAQFQITRKGDERAIFRSEQVARHSGVAGA